MTRNAALAAAFGARLKQLRKAGGLSQADLAARVDPPMQLQAIARYEAGKSCPTIDVLERLAKALGVTPCHLLPDGRKRK